MSANVTWEDLRAEYEDVRIGQLWLDEVRDMVGRVVFSYAPGPYSETGEWNPASLENLVQDVVVLQLLEEGQLDFIMDASTDVSGVRGLLNRLVRRTLANGRRRTVVDNLLERVRDVRPFVADGTLPAADRSDLYAAATNVSRLPRIRIVNSDRAPAVFSGEVLREAVEIADRQLGRPATRSEFSRILELVLTDYLPGGLVQDDGQMDEPDRGLTPEEDLAVQDTLDQLLRLPEKALATLAVKIDGQSDDALARHLGVSRPTAAKRFGEASARVETVLSGVGERVQDEVLPRFADALLRHHLPNPNTVTDTEVGEQ